MDLDLLGRDDAPPPFGLDRFMRQIGVVIAVTHARAMGNLVEAIACLHRPDLHRLEENVVPSVAHRPSRIKTSRRRAENLTGGELALSVCGAGASRSSCFRVDRRFGRRNAAARRT